MNVKMSCKQCGRNIKEKSTINYEFVSYTRKLIEIIPVADGGLIDQNLDCGVFCNDICLHDYLSFEGEAE